MVLYDVILVGFSGPPKVGSSPAEAIAKVFGIDAATAAAMADAAPTVVRSGVTEDVARKYFGAFRYIGAECEFRLATAEGGGETAPESALTGTIPPIVEPLVAGPGSVTRSVTGEIGRAIGSEPDFVVDFSAGPEGVPFDDPGSWAEIALRGTYPDADTRPDTGDPAADGGFALEDGAWSGSRSSEVARRADTSSAESASSDHRSSGRGSQSSGSQRNRHRPSVAEVRAAWTAGKDIELESESLSAPANARPTGDDWDRWIDTGLPDADFPSGLALVDGPTGTDVHDDTAGGTRLEAPRQSILLAQLDARVRGDRAQSQSTETSSRSEDRTNSTESSVELFGPPPGETARPTPQPKPTDSTPSSRTAATSAPSTEVPKAALNFRRVRSGPDPMKGSDD